MPETKTVGLITWHLPIYLFKNILGSYSLKRQSDVCQLFAFYLEGKKYVQNRLIYGAFVDLDFTKELGAVQEHVGLTISSKNQEQMNERR